MVRLDRKCFAAENARRLLYVAHVAGSTATQLGAKEGVNTDRNTGPAVSRMCVF